MSPLILGSLPDVECFQMPEPMLVRLFVVRLALLVVYCALYAACHPVRSESVADAHGVTYSVFWPLAHLCER